MLRRAVLVFAFCALVFLSVSCVSIGYSKLTAVTNLVRTQEYDEARQLLESQKDNLYSSKDKVLYALDSGMLAHYDGDFVASNKNLAAAEQLIFDYYAKSVSQAVGAAVINDTVTDYAGEDYEDIYTNIFMALNYLQKNNPDAAFVEVRRFTNKMKGLSVKYRDQILSAKKNAGLETEPETSLQFVDSALARYLSLILFRSSGDLSSAQVDARFIKEAFALQPALYPFPPPSWLQDELNVPDSLARLNIIALAGLAPYKVDETVRVPFHDSYLKISLPVMIKQPTQVASVRVRVSDLASVPLELLESIENIALDTFNQKKDLIYFRSIARASAKFAASTALAVASDHSDREGNGAASMVLGLLNLGSMVFTEVTEQADTRVSGFFPGRVYAGGLTLPPGTYTVAVDFADLNGKILYTKQYGDVVVAEKGPNVLEAVYLK